MKFIEVRELLKKYNRMAIDIYMCQFLYNVKFTDEFLRILPSLSDGRKKQILFAFYLKKAEKIEEIVLLSRQRFINLETVMDYIIQEKFSMPIDDILELGFDPKLTDSILRIGAHGINILRYCKKYELRMNIKLVNEFASCKILKININALMKTEGTIFDIYDKRKQICLSRYVKFLMQEFGITESQAKDILKNY